MAKGKIAPAKLRAFPWKRWVRAPDNLLLDELYIPALSCAVRYDRCCAYFRSSVLSTAARGFGQFIQNLLALGDNAPKPAARLIANEELAPADLNALLVTGDQTKLIDKILKQFKTPRDALEKNRLEMLAWLVASGYLELRIGLMRSTQGLVHAKFGIITDLRGDSLVFMGSDNETGVAITENYEELEISTSWKDKERFDYFRQRFDSLWENRDDSVTTLPLPEAVRQKLIKLAPKEPPSELMLDKQTVATSIMWHYLAAAPYLPNGEYACDATAFVELWPHQHKVVEDCSKAFPSGRLLCDEVGMGKTIEAILIIRRLLAGRGVSRALLLVPAGLLSQWQDELREKGGLLIPRWEDGYLTSPNGQRKRIEARLAFQEQPVMLISREWARMENNREVLLTSPAWDLVLLDEAHAARRASPIETEFNSANLLLTLLRDLQLRRRARGILLMSATPMQTQPWEPWDLLGVLGVGGDWMVEFEDIRDFYAGVEALRRGELTPPGAIAIGRLAARDSEFPKYPKRPLGADAKTFGQNLLFLRKDERELCTKYLRQSAPLGRRMHRNTRDTLRDYFAKKMLDLPPPQRQIDDVVFDYTSPIERSCYEAIEQYINERFDQLEKEKTGKGFVMTVYRRRMASSPAALRCSLKRRLDKLQAVIDRHWTSQSLSPEEEGVDPRDLSDSDIDERIDPALPSNPKVAQAERIEILKLVNMLNELGSTDTKFDEFVRTLKEITADGRSALVFTEYTDTMDYLRDLLQPTYSSTLGCFSGAGGQLWEGGKWVTVSKADITDRLGKGQIQVLICTDAASEGLNLQAASSLINYDLPWNPSKVEQRIGRIDRIGQQQKVLPIRNMFLQDSVDMLVYKALRERCGLFEHFVGRMQPVLTLARDALRRNLRPAQTGTILGELNKRIGEIKKDSTLEGIYLESEAAVPVQVAPPVDKHTLAAALDALGTAQGFVKAKRLKDSSSWKLRGATKKSLKVTLAREDLERDGSFIPMTEGAEVVSQIAQKLPIPSRIPFVVGQHQSGSYRCMEARWVTSGGFIPIESAERLSKLLYDWDGSAPTPSHLAAALNDANKCARLRVDKMKRKAFETEQKSIRHQTEAAQGRLRRELARTLRCLGGGDLNSLLRRQVQQESRSDERYHRSLELLGGYPAWTPEEIDDASSFVSGLSAHLRQARVALPTPLDAAIEDPRWLAR